MDYSEDGGRPPIPADIRRRVLVEAGHRCAIPTCRHLDVDVHHIIEWAQCKTHDYDNLIALCPNCHRRAHKGEIDRKSLRLYKINLRFTHDKYSQLEVDILFELSKIQALIWPPFNHILLKRIIESGFVEVKDHPNVRSYSGGLRTSPDIIRLTPKGVRFIHDLSLHEF